MRLHTVIIRNGGILKIDGDPLYGDAGIAACLADTEDNIRPACRYGFLQDRAGARKRYRDFRFCNFRAADTVRKPPDGFTGWIDQFLIKWLKACKQYFHQISSGIFLFLNFTILNKTGQCPTQVDNSSSCQPTVDLPLQN